MHKMLTFLCVTMLLLASAGCSSRSQNLQPVSVETAAYPAPAAWAMQPASNSLELLDQTFSVSDQPSSPTEQK